MKFKILTVGDIHFGYYPAKLLYIEFKIIIKRVEEGDIDLVVIVGDYFENRLSLSSPHSVYALKAFSDLLKACEDTNTKLRVIRGTHSHDPENQLNTLATMAKTSKCDFRLFNTVDEEEVLPSMHVLYIPEDYMEDKDEYYKEYFNKKYDCIFGHGMFEETNFSNNKYTTMKKYPVFNSIQMESICRGPIVFGHIHKSTQILDRIRYTGSFTRSKYGEEEEKGFFIVDYDTDSHATDFQFIINESATKFDTIEITEDSSVFTMLVNDQIKYLKDVVSKYKRENLRIKINIPDNYASSTQFIDSVNVVFANMSDVQVKVVENQKGKMQKENKEVIDKLMLKYGFIFDKKITYDDKIQMFIKAKYNKDISIERIRKLIS